MDELTSLLVRAREGDQAALAQWVRRTQAEVVRVCGALAGRDRAEDVAQDTYLRAVGALHRFRAESSARTWLLAIARRAAADDVRSRVRGRRLGARLAGQPACPPEPDHAGPAELDVLVTALPPGRREAFVLTQIARLPYAEAAAACGVPVGTIRSRVARAREDLAAALQHRVPQAEQHGDADQGEPDVAQGQQPA